MKIFFIFFALSLIACHSSENIFTPSEPLKTQVVKLERGLGTVTITLPVRYDTTFTWVHYSDCGAPCEKRKYRFQPKSLPVNAENGYFYKTLNDSVEQLTIVHNPYIAAEDSDKTDNKDFITSFHDHKKFYIVIDPKLRVIKSDTIEKINDRYFSIIVIDKYDSAKKEYSKKLLSTTTIRRGTIDFDFELQRKQDDSLTHNFIKNSEYYLRTIRIVEANK